VAARQYQDQHEIRGAAAPAFHLVPGGAAPLLPPTLSPVHKRACCSGAAKVPSVLGIPVALHLRTLLRNVPPHLCVQMMQTTDDDSSDQPRAAFR
jgi:hypothetical protein